MMERLINKVALVTGAGSGIGEATAKLFAKEGAAVVVSDINVMTAQNTVDQILAAGGKAISVKQDVAQEDDWKLVVKAATESFGGIDILVNNAGVTLLKTIEEVSLSEWRQHMSINLDSVFLGTQYAIEAMKKRASGSIINVSSVMGMVGEPAEPAYNASKGGVRIFTKSVALHCARAGYAIRVNSIHPGYIMTPLVEQAVAELPNGEAMLQETIQKTPLGHLGEPIDIAYGILYLASEESKFMTGSELVVDGGFLA